MNVTPQDLLFKIGVLTVENDLLREENDSLREERDRFLNELAEARRDLDRTENED